MLYQRTEKRPGSFQQQIIDIDTLSGLTLLGGDISTLDLIGVGICICDEADIVRYANAMYRSVFLSSWDDRPIEFTDALMAEIQAGHGIKLESGNSSDFETRVRRRRREQVGSVSFTTDTADGRWWSVTDARLPGGGIIAIAQDITRLKLEEFELRYAHASAVQEASTDYLTGVPNRRYGLRDAEAVFKTCRARGGLFTIAILDIDHFKAINDTHGHDVGDRVLIHFAKLVSSLVGPQIGFSRIGGEEFLLASPDPDPAGLECLLSMMLCPVPSLKIDGERGEMHVTVSAGLASALPEETFGDLLHRADLALYEAKAKGRNRVERAGPSG